MVCNALLDEGFAVYLPHFGAHSRVDLVYGSDSSGLRRMQVKSARLVDDVVTFATCSHTGGIRKGYLGEVDDFGVYCPATDEVYLVPVGDVPSNYGFLRKAPTKSKQLKGIRWADQYVLRRGGAATSV